jgi:hypothetical protein
MAKLIVSQALSFAIVGALMGTAVTYLLMQESPKVNTLPIDSFPEPVWRTSQTIHIQTLVCQINNSS